MEWFALALVLGIIVWMALVIISALRNKKVTIDSVYALRMLPAGQPLELEGQWVKTDEYSSTWQTLRVRSYSQADARIAFESYVLVHEGMYDALPLSPYMERLLKMFPSLFERLASRTAFVSLSDFIQFVALFDMHLLDRLKAREVDPSEYQLDRSGWDDEDDD
jgi:hypothetical protein